MTFLGCKTGKSLGQDFKSQDLIQESKRDFTIRGFPKQMRDLEPIVSNKDV